MHNDILSLLEKNAKLTAEEIAVYLGLTEEFVKNEIKKMEDEQIICGYGAFINWERTGEEFLTALIEVKVTPSRGQGFNRIAERIYRFKEVKAVYLMSGGYDLSVIVEGKSIKDISHFVSDKLSPLESVLSSATHFVLKRYKDHGIIFNEEGDEDERMIVSP
ncbi:MAG: Lrp/AsnC family transcriptional regulator [Lachnospiraceae bacterium]|nr:Lrp/AsnC family transcriptional regulator [Lachnospiraceae bacterium]